MQATAASPDPELHPAPAPGNILQHLVQLERLELPGGLTDAALQHVSQLTKLHHLQLGHLRHAKPAAVVGLQQLRSLTLLQLLDLRCNLSTSTVPPFSQLGKLQHLGLSWCVASRSMQPALLKGMTGLQVLSLQRVTLQDAAGATGGAELLALLPQLQDLSALQLNNVGGMSDCHAAAFMSLTRSTALQRLCLTRLKHDGRGGGIWQHVFWGSGYGSLTELQLGSVQPRLATGDVSAMVTCCPALQRLNITDAVDASAQLYPLRQLPGLTELTMHMYDTVATPSLAGLPARELWHLTGLRSLDTSCLTPPSSSSHFGILQLTGLQQLTSLNLTVAGGWFLCDDYWTTNFYKSWAWSFFTGCDPNWSYGGAVSRSFQNTSPAGAIPDVSVQLQAAVDKACQAARMPPQMQQPY